MTKKETYVLTEDVSEGVRRVVLNRPDKRNALSNSLRKELFSSLEEADNDPSVRAIIICGAGSCFSSGYDLSSDVSSELPYHTGKTDGFWPRHVVEGAFRIWDLSTPVIAQVPCSTSGPSKQLRVVSQTQSRILSNFQINRSLWYIQADLVRSDVSAFVFDKNNDLRRLVNINNYGRFIS